MGAVIGVTLWFTEEELEATDDALGASVDLLGEMRAPEKFQHYRDAYEKVHRALLDREDRR